jgi:glycosyltransferase involved in cell wall biosynthesis
MPRETRRRKILFVIRSLNIGGAERQLIELAGGLKRVGWDVTLATFYDGGVLQPELAPRGVAHVSLRKRGRWDVLPFLYRLVSLVRGERPDVVYSMLTMSNVLLGLLAPLLRPARVVWGVASSDMDESYYDWLARVESALEVRLANRADLIISNSFAGRDWHVARGYPAARTMVVCNGIDVERFGPDASAREEVRAEWGIGPDEKLVGIVARLDPIKDHRNFLAAARAVATRRGDVRFVCIGDGSADYRRELVAFTAELGLAQRVSWVPERTDIERVYNALDLLVSSSISEGLTNVIAEAMATDVRCVATCAGDSAQLVRNPRWLAPTCDSVALADAICRGLDDPGDPAGTQRNRIVNSYSVAALIDRTATSLEGMLPAVPDVQADPGAPALPQAAPKIMLLTRRLDVGGAQRQLVELAVGLQRAGCPVCVATFYGGGALAAHLTASGVLLVDLEKSGRWDIVGFAGRLISFVRRERPAIVHGYLDTSNVMLTLLRPFLGGARVVWGVRASNMDLSRYDRLTRLESRVARVLARRADLIICNSEAGRAFHVGLGYPAERMVVIPNGVDPSRYRPDAAARDALRREWCIDEAECLVGLAARLDPMKDHGTFLTAAARVAAMRPHVRFVCIGDGPADYRDALIETARRLGLADRVTWAGARGDMWRVYNALDLAVSSSSFGEGFPNAILEAMATGIPCVATNVGDSAIIIGELGWVCPPADSAALATALLRAIDALPCDALRVRDHVVNAYSSSMLLERTLARLAPLTARASAVRRASIGESP